jgi:Fibronectin type III domain
MDICGVPNMNGGKRRARTDGAAMAITILVASVGVLSGLLVVIGAPAPQQPVSTQTGQGNGSDTSPVVSISPFINSATFTVQNYSPARTTGPSDDSFFGSSTNWNEPFTSTDAKYLSEANVTMWRYPGGSNGDDFNFSTNEQPTTGTVAQNSISSFVSLCETYGCHAMLQLPLEPDNPGIVAQDVNYIVNTLHFEPYVWELGNEPGYWDNYGQPWADWATSPTSTCSPSCFGALLPAMVAAVRQYSNAPISGIGGVGAGNGPGGAYAYYEAVAAAVGPSIQYISLHSYNGGNNHTSVSSFYSAASANNNLSASLLNAHAALTAGCASYTGAQITACSEVGILISEFGASTKQKNIAYETGYPMVLWEGAGLVHAFQGNADAIDPFAYDNEYPGSFIVTKPILNPVYYFYKDIAKFMGNVVLNTTVTVGSTSIYKTTYVGATWQHPNNWALLITNTATTSQLNLTIEGSGFPTHGAIMVYTWATNATEPVGSTHSYLNYTVVAPQSLELVMVGPNVAQGIPAAPVYPYVSATNSTSVRLTWGQPGNQIINDSVTYGTPSGSAPYCTPTGTQSAGYGVSGLTVTGLSPLKTYCFGARAWSTAGGSSVSSYVNATTPLASPGNFTATSIGTLYGNLSWTAPAIHSPYSIQGYNVTIGGTCGGTISTFHISGSGTLYKNVTGLRNGATYCATVQAWYSGGGVAGNGQKGFTNFTALTNPPVAATLTEHGAAGGDGTWTVGPFPVSANALLIGAVEIRSTGTGDIVDSAGNHWVELQQLTSTTGQQSSLTVWDVASAVSSAEDTFTCSHGATSVGACEILEYTDGGTVPVDHLGFANTNTISAGVNPWSTVNSSYANDTFALFVGAGVHNQSVVTYTSGSLSVLDQAHGTNTSTGNTVSSGDAAHFEANPVRNLNLSLTSNSGSGNSWEALAVSFRGYSGVQGPTNVTVASFTQTSITLNWTNPAGVLANDTIWYSTNNVTFHPVYLNAVVQTGTVTGLIRGTPYYLFVSANTTQLAGGESTVIQFTPTYPAPPAPTNLVLTQSSYTGLNISWTNPSSAGVLNNSVYYSIDNSTWIEIDTATEVSTYSLTYLSPNTRYYVYVTAHSVSGESNPSNTLVAVTNSVNNVGLAVSSETTSSISLSWTNPLGYVVRNDTVVYGRGYSCTDLSYTLSAGVTDATNVNNLQFSTDYCFAIQLWIQNYTYSGGSQPQALSAFVVGETLGQPGPKTSPPSPSPENNSTAPCSILCGLGATAKVILEVAAYSGAAAMIVVGVIMVVQPNPRWRPGGLLLASAGVVIFVFAIGLTYPL